MVFKRRIAFRLNIADIVGNPFKKEEGGPGYLDLMNKKIVRVCIMGTIVNKFVSEDVNYAALTLDDSTETIRAKLWRDERGTIDKVAELKIGDEVDIVGRVREYNDEVYIAPEIVTKIEDPNAIITRKLEIIELKKVLPNMTQEEFQARESSEKKDILSLIKEGNNTFEKIKSKISIPEEELKLQIAELLEEGDIYEPKKGEYGVI